MGYKWKPSKAARAAYAEQMAEIIRDGADLHDQDALAEIYNLARSKFTIMDGTGYIATVGDFIEEDDGLLYSNMTYLPVDRRFTFQPVIAGF